MASNVAGSQEATRTELRDMLERGALYADRFPPSLRDALDVADPLTELVTRALGERKAVVLSGNAGDGKSHLAQRALDALPTRSCIEVTAGHPAPTPVPRDTVVFIRDASALTNAEVLTAVVAAVDGQAPLLITINEGPLNSLAADSTGEFFRGVRDVLHRRARGIRAGDPERMLILSLSGRQLAKSEFVEGALSKLLPLAGPCSTCGTSRDCPRVVGARTLRRSRRARERVAALLQLLTDRGRHVSAREIWLFLTDMFFAWTCSAGQDEVDRAAGYFWVRLFESDNRLSHEIALEFDPINAPMAREDILLWQGKFAELDYDQEFPGLSPAAVARESREDGLRLFASAKRAFFFMSKSLDPQSLLARQTMAPEFGRLLSTASTESRRVIRELVGLINRYRLDARTENDLWVSRHHSMAAHKRPYALAAAAKLPIERLEISVPFAYEAENYEGAGFFPDRLLLRWAGSEQVLAVSFDTWRRLQEERSMTVDRDQEGLDFALDLFMSQAPAPALEDPEVHYYDHERHEEIVIRLKPGDRSIELL
jgi:hypothetical protein